MDQITRLFPLWALGLAGVAYWVPAPFVELKAGIVPLLTVIMFSMGLTLRPDDFRRVLRMPKLIISGLFLQYSIMPLAALLIAQLLALDSALTIGMILVGTCPGGTASNVITYLARGNVALSISLTSLSTLLAVFLTPLLTLFLADTSVEVPTLKMLVSILYIVILPVASGLLLKHFFDRYLSKIERVLPFIAMLSIVIIIAIITALNASQLNQLAVTLVLAVALHNGTGLLLGYGFARLQGFPAPESRTLAIEVGMQNSGLAVALAMKHFSVAAALPGAIFSIWHNLSGSFLALIWSKTPASKKNNA